MGLIYNKVENLSEAILLVYLYLNLLRIEDYKVVFEDGHLVVMKPVIQRVQMDTVSVEPEMRNMYTVHTLVRFDFTEIHNCDETSKLLEFLSNKTHLNLAGFKQVYREDLIPLFENTTFVECLKNTFELLEVDVPRNFGLFFGYFKLNSKKI
jgi:hypothetical protein